MKHTPGPWHVVRNRRSLTVKAGQKSICTFSIGWKGCDETQVKINARLIATAPELLERGAKLLDAAERHIFGDECKAERDAFRATLAKVMTL